MAYYGANFRSSGPSPETVDLMQNALELENEKRKQETELLAAKIEEERQKTEAAQRWNEAIQRVQNRVGNPYVVAQPIPETPEELGARAQLATDLAGQGDAAQVVYNPVVEQAPWRGDPNLIVKGNYSEYLADQVKHGLMAPVRNAAVDLNVNPNRILQEELGPLGWKPTPEKPVTSEAKVVGGSLAVLNPKSGEYEFKTPPSSKISESDRQELDIYKNALADLDKQEAAIVSQEQMPGTDASGLDARLQRLRTMRVFPQMKIDEILSRYRKPTAQPTSSPAAATVSGKTRKIVLDKNGVPRFAQ